MSKTILEDLETGRPVFTDSGNLIEYQNGIYILGESSYSPNPFGDMTMPITRIPSQNIEFKTGGFKRINQGILLGLGDSKTLEKDRIGIYTTLSKKYKTGLILEIKTKEQLVESSKERISIYLSRLALSQFNHQQPKIKQQSVLKDFLETTPFRLFLE